jgi:hypothetical protein
MHTYFQQPQDPTKPKSREGSPLIGQPYLPIPSVPYFAMQSDYPYIASPFVAPVPVYIPPSLDAYQVFMPPMCDLCQKYPKSTTLNPCLHTCCEHCSAENSKKCPYCQKEVTSVTTSAIPLSSSPYIISGQIDPNLFQYLQPKSSQP